MRLHGIEDIIGLVPQSVIVRQTRSQETDVFKPTTIRTRLLVCFIIVALLPVLAVSLASLGRDVAA